MAQVIYSQTRKPATARQRFSNPRFFTGPLPGVTTIYLDGDWPEIAKAYANEGADVVRLDALAADEAFNSADPAAFNHDGKGGAGGSLTKREIMADLDAMSVEYDPLATHDVLMAQRVQARAARANPS